MSVWTVHTQTHLNGGNREEIWSLGKPWQNVISKTSFCDQGMHLIALCPCKDKDRTEHVSFFKHRCLNRSSLPNC
eukprot:3111355-Amphidinium_carterae.1